jgi:outer membrane protein OmpA-like peptidoglycan-associated protein
MIFAHTLFGYNRLNVPLVDTSNGIGAILGGGMDLNIWKRLSLRLFEADYVWAHHNFSKEVSPTFADLARPDLQGVRLRTGIVLNFGYPNPAIPAASCSIQPSEVMVGEPVTVNASATNFNPKHPLTYNWSGTGGKVTGKDNTATIDTNGVAGGSYAVTARVVDPKVKRGGEASCTANYTVKEPPKNPPTMSCSANPASVQAGTPSTVTCSCTSPDNVPVTVSSWTASGGSVSGDGNTATLNTTGASAGPITVSATCTDSRGLTAPASSQVTVEVPPPPPPEASKLSECEFPNKVKPWRVDNTCKAILDDVAQRLQHDPDSKLVIVGNAEPGEKRKNLAGERAVNSKAYLSGGEAKQAIDASRIEVRTGSAGTKTAEYWVVPAGANFSGSGTETVDESKVKAVPDHPAAAKKKAAKPKAQ